MTLSFTMQNDNFQNLGRHIESAARRGLPLVEKDRHAGEPGAIICCPAPSLETPETIAAVKAYAERGYRIFGIKDAIRFCRDQGLEVAYSANMDPGTADIARTPVFEGVTYCLASSCHPALFDHVLDGGGRVEVYHSACGYQRREQVPGFVIDLPPAQSAVVQGTYEMQTADDLAFCPVMVRAQDECSVYRDLFGCGDVMIGGFTVANRASALASYMGFKDLVLAGADFGWRAERGDIYYASFVAAEPADRQFMSDSGSIDGRPWKTRADLLASAVDVAKKVKKGEITVLGDSLANAIARKPIGEAEGESFRAQLAESLEVQISDLKHLDGHDCWMNWISHVKPQKKAAA